jgi:mRNA interferase RelE/StbE
MESYKILIRKPAADELNRVPKRDLRRIIGRIRGLGSEPRPDGCEKLSAQERYRLRQGDYRIVYSIDDAGRSVEIVKIGHRSEVYRR